MSPKHSPLSPRATILPSKDKMYCAPFFEHSSAIESVSSTRPTGISFGYPVERERKVLIDGIGRLIFALLGSNFPRSTFSITTSLKCIGPRKTLTAEAPNSR